MRLSVFALILLLAAYGCGSDEESKPAPRTVDPKSESIRAAVESNASVALALHSKFREQPGNLFYSPLSIEAVLGMLYAGSDGDTAKQIGAVLGSVDDPRALHEGLGALLGDLAGDRKDRGYTLSVANRIWAQQGLESSDDFVEITRELYNAPMRAADYSDPEKVREAINDWVSDQTSGEIPKLLEAGQLTPLTVMTIVNAIYFKADWAIRFDEKHTRPEAFHRDDGTDVTADMMMYDGGNARVYFSDDIQAAELAYRGGDLSFLGIAPASYWDDGHQRKSLSDVEAMLDDSMLHEIIDNLSHGESRVIMPRFSLRSRIDMIPTLRALGIVDLFDSGLADLAKIDPNKDLSVDPFVHEATIRVDEAGTVAAAATAAGVEDESAPAAVQLDQPFLFFIRDDLTGAILFTGRVADPTEG